MNTKGSPMNKKTTAVSPEPKAQTQPTPVPTPTKVQIHAGNIGVLTVQLLGEINAKLDKVIEKLSTKDLLNG